MVKDKKIKVYKYAVTGTGIHEKKGYSPLYPAPIWAYYRDLSTKEMSVATGSFAQANCIFEVNYHPEINNNDIIFFRGQYYSIIAVDHFEGYRGDIRLTCKSIAKPTDITE